jgi:hypothetical protein
MLIYWLVIHHPPIKFYFIISKKSNDNLLYFFILIKNYFKLCNFINNLKNIKEFHFFLLFTKNIYYKSL